jgi:hypothetical protein
MRDVIRVCIVALVLASFGSGAKDKPKTDDEIKQELIRESIVANYPGTCACPYNVDRLGTGAAAAARTVGPVAMIRYVRQFKALSRTCLDSLLQELLDSR